MPMPEESEGATVEPYHVFVPDRACYHRRKRIVVEYEIDVNARDPLNPRVPPSEARPIWRVWECPVCENNAIQYAGETWIEWEGELIRERGELL